MSEPGNLRPQAFAGTAEDYLRHRAPYPQALLDAVAGAAPGRGLLVDLACGPGRIALDLAGRFERVVAVDLEPEMVAVGRREAAGRGIGNVEWRTGRAEDLELRPGSVDLITIGEAFHRLDQGMVTAKAMDWLRPDGVLATMGGGGVLNGVEPWEVAVSDVARRWMARAFPEGWGEGRSGADVGPGSQARVMRAAGFVRIVEPMFEEPFERTVDGVLGYLRSTSVCSSRALGELQAGFEAEVRATLAEFGVGPYVETFQAGSTIGRKPL